MYKKFKKWVKFTIIRWKFKEFLFRVKIDQNMEFELGYKVPLSNGSIIEYVGKNLWRYWTIKTRAQA